MIRSDIYIVPHAYYVLTPVHGVQQRGIHNMYCTDVIGRHAWLKLVTDGQINDLLHELISRVAGCSLPCSFF